MLATFATRPRGSVLLVLGAALETSAGQLAVERVSRDAKCLRCPADIPAIRGERCPQLVVAHRAKPRGIATTKTTPSTPTTQINNTQQKILKQILIPHTKFIF